MATTPTQLPVPSEKHQDLKFNAGKIDEFVTSMGGTYTDRFGNKHYTIEGINYLSQQVMNAFGYITLSGVSFTTGATVSTPNKVLFNTTDNSYYKWTGSFASGPKVVSENSTPESSGGVGPSKWLNVGDTVLRADLKSNEISKGSSLIKYTPSFNPTVSLNLSEKLSIDVKTLTDYGFKVGNTGAQNKAAFQKAIDEATLPLEILMPPGAFLIEPDITINEKVVSIKGAGPYQTRLFPSSSGESLITQKNIGIGFFEISNLGIDGNGTISYGIKLTESNHTRIENVYIQGTKNNAIMINGYSNDVIGCRLFSNAGNGLSIGGVCNNYNIVNNRIYGNDYSGITISPDYQEGGMSIRINGNDLEQNKVCAILAYGTKGLNIDSNYFERNGETGYPYAVPENITVRADIHLISNNYTLIPDASKANDTVSIRGNQQTAIGYASTLPNQDGFIFTNYATNLLIENNQMLSQSKNNNLLAIYHNKLSSIISNRLAISGNTINSVGFIGSYDDLTQNPDAAHYIDVLNFSKPINYVDRNMLLWTAASGSTGSLVKTQNFYNGNYSFLVGDGDRTWISTTDLTKSTELKGKYVWFGAWTNDQGNAAKLVFGINGRLSDSVTVPSLGDGIWKFVSCCIFIENTATAINVNIRKYGSGNVLINTPSLCVVGVAYNNLSYERTTFRSPSVPSIGFWDKGERIINSNPAVGQPKAWTCNIAGGAGTVNFLSEGNF